MRHQADPAVDRRHRFGRALQQRAVVALYIVKRFPRGRSPAKMPSPCALYIDMGAQPPIWTSALDGSPLWKVTYIDSRAMRHFPIYMDSSTTRHLPYLYRRGRKGRHRACQPPDRTDAHQRRLSIEVIRLSACSRVVSLTNHCGAPTSLSIWASISSARLRRTASARRWR